MDRAPHSVQDLISIHPDPAGTVADLLVQEDQDLTVRALVRRTQDQDHTVRAPAHRTQDRDNTVQPRVPDLMARHRDNTVRGPRSLWFSTGSVRLRGSGSTEESSYRSGTARAADAA